jgi:hypothetical protein
MTGASLETTLVIERENQRWTVHLMFRGEAADLFKQFEVALREIKRRGYEIHTPARG